jgi:hypothetical protein
MKKIEQVWNIVYYFVYKRYNAIFLTFGVTTEALFFKDIKSNRSITFMFILSLLISFSFFCILQSILNDNFLSSGFIIVFTLICAVPNYFLLLYKNKCVTYFKEFEAKPIQWKRKWSWISFAIVVMIVLFLIVSFKVMDYSLHQSGLWHEHPPHWRKVTFNHEPGASVRLCRSK